MVERDSAGEIVKRALAYPFAAPARSFLQVGTRTLELPPDGPDLSGRAPLLAYGANAAPAALARKLVALPDLPLPMLRAELRDHDVVYSAHVSFHGAVPATVEPCPGVSAPVFVAHPTPEQLDLLRASEPNYVLTHLAGMDAFLSRHGPLLLDGAPVALTAVESGGRSLAALTESEVLDLVRSKLAPELSLEQFVLRSVESGGLGPLPPLGRGESL